jgi:pyruvate/2-oxoglutarate dehydrogenase complex dihydrolipoamide acyltransferase (E2) component
MHEVIMPKLGLTMETGRIEKWHKKEGDRVGKGEVLFEVMTDKVTIEVESYDSGTLLKILRAEGDDVPVTEVVAYIGEQGEKVPENVIKKETAKKNKEPE